MKEFNNISAVLLWLFLPGILFGGNLTYRSDRLERMGEQLGEVNLAAVPDGEHTAALMFRNTPVTIIKEKGIIEHIGYSFFSADERSLSQALSFAIFWSDTPLRRIFRYKGRKPLTHNFWKTGSCSVKDPCHR